jgi:hypothetical protein
MYLWGCDVLYRISRIHPSNWKAFFLYFKGWDWLCVTRHIVCVLPYAGLLRRTRGMVFDKIVLSFSKITEFLIVNLKLKTKLHGLSPRANYTTERPPLVGEVIANFFCAQRVPRGQRDGSLRPYSWFSRQEPILFYQVAPQMYSRGWVDPVPDPLLFFSGSAGNRTRASGSVAKNSDH